MQTFGHFDDSNREYVITRPDTPLPWINYLGQGPFFSLISNTAGGYSFYKDARLRRITRYRYNNAPNDLGSRYLYLRDNKTSEYWSPTWQPVRRKLDTYKCRHGLGYTITESSYAGVFSQVRFFVPLDDPVEVWDVTIRNDSPTDVDLSLFACIEFSLWDALDDATNFQRNLSTGEVEVEEGVIYHKTEYRERRNHFAFFAASGETAGYDTQREAFLGPYHGWNEPASVEKGLCTNSLANGWAPIGAHHLKLHLEPQESKRLVFLLGYHENLAEDKFDPPGSQRINKCSVLPRIHRFFQHDAVEASFQELKKYWSQLLDVLQVNTPDEDTNRIVNVWNPYQSNITFHVSRSASYFESGVGRGIGFRDSNQDLLAFVQMAPALARRRILDLASTQLEDGGAYHQYQPLTRRGNDAIGGSFNDDPLWLILSTSAYVKETLDWSILDETVPFNNREGSEAPLWTHLQRSLDYTLSRRGPHGLPLIGRADWNDCLNLNTFSESPEESFQTAGQRDGKTAESTFIAGLFVLAAKEMGDLAEASGRASLADRFRSAAREMEEVTLTHAWDGRWFLRAFDSAGEPVGSSCCSEGQIYLEPQGICVMAGIGLSDGKARLAMQSVEERLATPHGIVLHQPAYTRYYLNLGEISSYPPGFKENAGVFCHANPWAMIASTLLGDGDRAFDYYRRINPSAREKISDIHKCEPYVYAQMIAGVDAPSFGEAKNSWLTGTAAWNYVAVTQWILGIRPTLAGLMFTPVIPQDWEGFDAVRKFRGVQYKLQVRRVGSGNTVALKVDGERIDGAVIPPPPPHRTSLFVEATLG